MRNCRTSCRLVLFCVGIAATAASFAPEAQAQPNRRTRGAASGERRPFAKPDTPRRLERLRSYDVKHMVIAVTITPKEDDPTPPKTDTAAGTVTHTLSPLFEKLDSVEFDSGAKVTVKKATLAANGGKPVECKFTTRDGKLKIAVDKPYGPKDTLDLAIAFETHNPTKGLYFTRPDAEHPKRSICIWTQGEAEETREWLPCYDAPNDRTTTETFVTVKKPLFVLSNGRLAEVEDAAQKGMATYHWKMELPHSTYLISLAIGDFEIVHDKAGGLPVDYYVLKPTDSATIRRAFGHTPKMVEFFGNYTGRPYPYAKYAQVVVPQFTAGGMENISATTLNDFIIADETSYLELSSDSLLAHELAHQWFGDYLTCTDWSQIWLNEGFASYFDPLFTEYDRGEEAFQIAMDRNKRQYLQSDRVYRRPIVETRYDEPERMFDAVTYPKGACILHTLRGVIGTKAFQKGIQEYVADHKLTNVTTDDFKKSMEHASGQDLKWFFDQWTQKGGHPELKAKWHYEPLDKTARVAIEQTQKVDEMTPLFRIPTVLSITDEQGTRDVPIVIDEAKHEFVVAAPLEPKMVRIDPKGWVLKTLDFEKPLAEWIYEIAHDPDVLGRLTAAEKLGAAKDNAAALHALADAWPKERTREARQAIVGELSKHGEAARGSLLKAAGDPDAHVRRVAAEALAQLGRDDSTEALFRKLWSDPKEAYGVRSAALAGLLKHNPKDKDALVAQGLAMKGKSDRIAAQALRELLNGDGPEMRQKALQLARGGDTPGMRRAALGKLASFAKDDREVQDALIALVDDNDRGVRISVWDALAEANVARALPALEARLKTEEQFAKRVLESAVERIKAAAKPKPPAGPTTPADSPAALEREAKDLEMQAKELLNKAEGLRLKAARAALNKPDSPAK